MSLEVQYTLVAIIIIAACIWMLRSFWRMRRSKRCDKGSDKSACAGCALSSTCKSDRARRTSCH